MSISLFYVTGKKQTEERKDRHSILKLQETDLRTTLGSHFLSCEQGNMALD